MAKHLFFYEINIKTQSTEICPKACENTVLQIYNNKLGILTLSKS
uniref:Uncharacterized protein n=1 Tax=Anguilla anguilla TaxID=7936 RepID=A0A0E9SXX7_ANGAN